MGDRITALMYQARKDSFHVMCWHNILCWCGR